MGKGVGIYVGRNEVIAVSVVRAIAGPQIKNFVIEPIRTTDPGGEKSSGEEGQKLKRLSPESQAIRNALQKIKEPGAYVNVALSPFHLVTRHFIMPAVPKKEAAEAIRYEASRYIPFKLSESILDYQAKETHKNVLSVTATAIKKDILHSYLKHLRMASAKVSMIEPVYSAVGRGLAALNMINKTKTQGFVVLHSDGNVHVTLVSKGIVYLSRDFLLSGTPEEDKTHFYEELKASLDYFYKLTGGDSITQIFLSGRADLKFWAEHLEHAFNYTIRFDLANFPAEKNISPENLSALLVSYGLALRALNYKSPLGDILLLPKEERKSTPQQLLAFIGLELAVVALFFFLVRFVGFQPYLSYLTRQNDQVFSEDTSADPRNSPISMEDMNNMQTNLSSRISQLEGFVKDKTLVNNLLSELAQGLPNSIWLDYISCEDAPGADVGIRQRGKKRMNIRGVCYLGSPEKEAQTLNNWGKSLTAKKSFNQSFSEVKLEEIKREQDMNRDTTRFRIICE